MSAFRDLRRLLDGVSLVAKEFLNLSPAATDANFQTLISCSLKKSILSATDLAGLTKGRVRQFANPRSKESVVYFSEESSSGADDGSDAKPNSEVSTERTEEKVFNFESSSVLESRDGRNLAESSATDEARDKNPEISEGERDGAEIVAGELPQKNGNDVAAAPPVKRRRPRERRVPSTPFSRALGFAGLGAGLAWGSIQESAKRIVFGASDSLDKQSTYSPFVSEQNAERLALALCRMRGAALKLGQMLSIQDESLVPAPILSALEIVRQGADVMPRSQLNQVLDNELGPNWSSKLLSFDYEPIAAASIGQVHRAVTKDGFDVAMKIQYPGVANSIESDIENVRRLLEYTNLIPKGLYLDRAMKVAKEELSRECDYELEAANQKRFRELSSIAEGFYVPIVVDDISSKRVLTTELVSGIPIDKVAALDEETRNYVGKKLLELTLKELFVHRFMQTDPNWSNFLFDEATKVINLIDFGAAREYPVNFVDDYLRMVLACANCNKDAVIETSRRLGFLTGMESEVMLEAHVQAAFLVGLPFSRRGGYDFRSSNITRSISDLGATMLKHRLTPPPDEAYSLHRKLSGAFLACMKLGAVVPCRELLMEVYEQYQFSDNGVEVLSGSMS